MTCSLRESCGEREAEHKDMSRLLTLNFRLLTVKLIQILILKKSKYLFKQSKPKKKEQQLRQRSYCWTAIYMQSNAQQFESMQSNGMQCCEQKP